MELFNTMNQDRPTGKIQYKNLLNLKVFAPKIRFICFLGARPIDQKHRQLHLLNDTIWANQNLEIFIKHNTMDMLTFFKISYVDKESQQ